MPPTSVTTFLRSPNRRTATRFRVALTQARPVRVLRRMFGNGTTPSFEIANVRLGDVVHPEWTPDAPTGLGPQHVRLPAEVVVYFGENRRKLYQLRQWLPVLAHLHATHPVLLVFRDLPSMRLATAETDLPSVYVRRLGELISLYDGADYKAALYVNNGASNFQSLSFPRLLHVHINHGESDKVSMVSNQAKGYDRVFVAGEAAVRRHRHALMEMDEWRLIPVGRPQLDLRFDSVLPPNSRRTVLYAPTWEGESEHNNYSSVDRYGEMIVTALLGIDDVRVVYKPHPRVGESRTPAMRAAHERIVALIDDAARRDPQAGHQVSPPADILALLGDCDAMITDVSSVGLDFLYLRTDRPLFITDRRSDRAALAREAPVSAAADVIDEASVDALATTVAARLRSDDRAEERLEMRRFYFGDLSPGESTARFIAAVGEAIADRDRMQADRSDAVAQADRGPSVAISRGGDHA